MKNLVVCCDGTWNTPDQEQDELPSPTNVAKLYNAVDTGAADRAQETYYHSGVGTEGKLLERTAGGMYGLGLSKNILSAYVWLASRYQPGDHIYLFGFSRGAFTVRSLAGFINKCGLLDVAELTTGDAYARAKAAYDGGYRSTQKVDWQKDGWRLIGDGAVPIRFVGVWDTVGALGIPDDMALLNVLDNPKNWQFHDCTLAGNVLCARHAIALDERRASFTPTLWIDPATNAPYANSGRVCQLWFPGVHCDVGGGYSACGLSDITLKWMLDEAAAQGLRFRPGMVAQLKPDPQGPLHDSVRGVFKALRTRPRNIPRFPDSSYLHSAAIARHNSPPITQAFYHKTVRLAPGEEAKVDVFAREHWCPTGLYLEAGTTYSFHAEGQWLDSSIPCGPSGMQDGKFHLGEVVHVVASMAGEAEALFKRLTGNQAADFWGTRRVESIPWFALTGALANDGTDAATNPETDGSPREHQTFLIGENEEGLKVEKPGYLFAFANDAWAFYENNHGCLTLTVKRLA